MSSHSLQVVVTNLRVRVGSAYGEGTLILRTPGEKRRELAAGFNLAMVVGGAQSPQDDHSWMQPGVEAWTRMILGGGACLENIKETSLIFGVPQTCKPWPKDTYQAFLSDPFFQTPLHRLLAGFLPEAQRRRPQLKRLRREVETYLTVATSPVPEDALQAQARLVMLSDPERSLFGLEYWPLVRTLNSDALDRLRRAPEAAPLIMEVARQLPLASLKEGAPPLQERRHAEAALLGEEMTHNPLTILSWEKSSSQSWANRWITFPGGRYTTWSSLLDLPLQHSEVRDVLWTLGVDKYLKLLGKVPLRGTSEEILAAIEAMTFDPLKCAEEALDLSARLGKLLFRQDGVTERSLYRVSQSAGALMNKVHSSNPAAITMVAAYLDALETGEIEAPQDLQHHLDPLLWDTYSFLSNKKSAALAYRILMDAFGPLEAAEKVRELSRARHAYTPKQLLAIVKNPVIQDLPVEFWPSLL